MESIEIKNFLTIEYAYFEIKKINILIGEQAQGKSVIAKLVYFFKNFFTDVFIPSIECFETKRNINKNFIIQFEEIFPRYSWENKEFSIIYKYLNYTVSVTKNKSTLKLDYSENLEKIHKKLKSCYKQTLNKSNVELRQEKENIFNDVINKEKLDFEFNKISIFIPASRSFFALLQQNIFRLLAKDVCIDFFIKQFGSLYEQSKRLRQSTKFINKSYQKIDRLVNDIISGDYVYIQGEDWINNNGNITNLLNASSGQQESLPMLLILKFWAYDNESEIINMFFIEEPEAHLFPTSQKKIISLIATLYNAFGHSFFITTHSPYILTAINNLVVGKDAYDKAQGDNEKLAQLEKVLPKDELIALEDVSAYTLTQGKLESIINWENRLIGANILDSVSDEFDNTFSIATDILYGD